MMKGINVIVLLKTIGLSALQKSMRKRAQSLKNREKVNAQATVVVDGWIQRNFNAQGAMSMGGKGWKPLQAATLKARRHGLGKGSGKILQNSGDLRKRWKHLWSVKLAKVQSGVTYGIYHEKGTKHLPVRRILPQNKQIWPLIEKLYSQFIKKILR